MQGLEENNVRFTCQSCGRAYAVSDELSGRAFKMKCKGCGQEIVVRPANPATGVPAETTGMVPLPAARTAPVPRASPPPPAVAPPTPTVAPPPTAVAPPPPAVAPPPARLQEGPPARPIEASQPPPPPGPVEYDLDPLAGLDAEIEAQEAAPAPPSPPAPPAKLPAREVPRGPVTSSAPPKPVATPPPRRSLVKPGIALLTVLLILGAGFAYLRGRLPDRAPAPPAPMAETPVLPAAPRPEPQTAALPAAPLPAAAETAAPDATVKPSPAVSPAPPPARTPATARAERPQAARDLPVERARTESVPPPSRQPAATAASPADPGPALVASASTPAAPAPVAAAPTVPAAAVAAPAAAAPAPAAPAAAVAAPAPEPTYVADKFQSPRLASRTCIAEKLRLTSQLDDSAPEVVTVRVEVGATGVPTQVQVMGEGVDRGISDAIRRAVLACEWVPGTDAQGKPAPFWAVQPIRLAR